MKRRTFVTSMMGSALSSPHLLCAGQTAAAEWPQWRGPDRTAVSRETGLLKSWPQGGPKLIWRANGLGGGYSTPSVSGGRLFGLGWRGNDEVVWCMDTDSRGLWITRIAAPNYDIGQQAQAGSGSSPTVDGDRVYALGTSGDLACLEVGTGKIRWQKSLVRDFGGGVPDWGYAESPLVDGDRVIATPGGRQATMVALNKNTGDVVWRAPLGDGAQYASAIVADVDGVRQYIQLTGGGVISVAAPNGRLLWRNNFAAYNTANCPTPIYSDHHVFAAAGYGKGGVCVRLAATPGGVSAQEVYSTRNMKNHHGGVVLVGQHLYGFDDPGTLTCLDFKSGQVAWTNRSVGKGSLICADGHLYCRSESRGTIALVEANPQSYVEKSRFEQPERRREMAWSHPVVAGGRLYLRDQDLMLCYDVKGA